MNEEYRLADKAIALLHKRAIRRFEGAKTENAQLDFDELNVMQSAKRLYRELDKDNRTVWRELAKNKYKRCKPHGDFPPTLEWLNALLEGYDPVTKYIYENEVARKRDRLVEAVNATGQRWNSGNDKERKAIVDDVRGKEKEYKKALGYWVRMTAHYTDSVSDSATVKAYADAGVEEVVWHTAEDDRVCEECNALDGEVFKIDRIPPKPHWGCRCYVRAVQKTSEE